MNTKTTFLALAAMTLAACTNNENEPQRVSEFITIDALVGTPTRATATAFQTGDAISIYAWTGNTSTVDTPLVVDNSVNTFDGSQWTAAPQKCSGKTRLRLTISSVSILRRQ